MRLEDLPQGPIGPAAAPPPSPRERGEDGGGDGRQDGSAEDENENENENEPQYPTVVLQARRNMRKFDSCVLLTRVGGFYELYFEHAEEYGPLLNLKVAQKKTSAGPVPMVSVIVLSSFQLLSKVSTSFCPAARCLLSLPWVSRSPAW